jgi:hypothetical protein
VAKKHFTGRGNCKIHTTRSTPSCKEFGCKSYDKVGTTTGYKPEAAHHIIPISALIAYQVEDPYKSVLTEIKEVYRNTRYCANQENNITWLPKKKTYLKGKPRNDVYPAVWGLNRPCHDWGHPSYTEEVKGMLRKQIWDKFANPKTKENCPGPDDVATAFKNVENDCRKLLEPGSDECRATRRGDGTLDSMTERNGELIPEWWFNFSMARDAKVSAEPAFSFGKSAKIPRALLRLQL